MLRTRWQKVLLDLWKNRGRTLVVALAIAVGVYAVGVVLDAREMVVREYQSDQSEALRASAILYTQPFDQDLAERIAQVPGVAAAEGRRVITASLYDARGVRRDLVLVAIPDFSRLGVDAIAPLHGAWPPDEREVILERQTLDFLGAAIGDALSIELRDGTEKQLALVGTAHDPQQLSPDVTSTATGYVTLKTVGSLGIEKSYTELRIRLAESNPDKAQIQSVVESVEEQLERTGRTVLSQQIITRGIADPFIDTLGLVLSSFGALILLLSGFLVVNAITALVAQQIPQIGVMKLIGARRGQIMGLYVTMVVVYGALAVALGLPAAALTARLITAKLVAWLINIRIDSYAVPASLMVVQVAVGVLLPLLAGLAPVIQGTRISTQRALSDTGMATGNYGRGGIERILARVQKVASLPRTLLLAIRNTLRHKGRLAQTLIVLTLGTALFISVVSVWASVNATVDNFMRYHRYDVSLQLGRPYRLQRLAQAAAQVPGVVAVEGWSVGSAVRQRSNDTKSDGMRIYAVPAGTSFMAPEVSAGRWLPGPGQGAIVVNSDLVDMEPDIGVGARLELEISGREQVWTVVGVVPTEADGPAVYVDREDYALETRTPDQATHLQVITARHDAAFQKEVETRLFEHFRDLGFDVGGTKTTQLMRAEDKLLFTIVVAFLVLMALLLAAVGGLGLTTTMSINILERVREIGVLRAIGASDNLVRRIVLVEGVAIGLLSWVVGTALSCPISRFLSEQLGLALIKVPLTFEYSIGAAIVWFVALQALAVAASLGPARNAVRLTVREVLAYE